MRIQRLLTVREVTQRSGIPLLLRGVLGGATTESMLWFSADAFLATSKVLLDTQPGQRMQITLTSHVLTASEQTGTQVWGEYDTNTYSMDTHTARDVLVSRSSGSVSVQEYTRRSLTLEKGFSTDRPDSVARTMAPPVNYKLVAALSEQEWQELQALPPETIWRVSIAAPE